MKKSIPELKGYLQSAVVHTSISISEAKSLDTLNYRVGRLDAYKDIFNEFFKESEDE